MKAVFIIGPSGSGKTTLTRTLSKAHDEYFGKNSSIVINLDCANQGGEIDICSLATLQEVMQELQLGPNGSLIYVAQLLQKNLQWLQSKIIQSIGKRNHSASILNNEHLKKKIKPQQIQINNILLIFDLPGQIQLFLAHDSLKNIVYSLIKKFTLQPCVLGLFDSTYLYNLADFTSMTMVSLSILCHLQLPYIGILSKIDLCAGRRPSDGSFQGYFTLTSLHQLLQQNKSSNQQQQLLQAIAKMIDQYSQVTFSPFSIYKPDLISSLFSQLENTFGTMQANLLKNRKFMNVFKDFVDDLGSEGVRVNLEAQLLAECEQELDYEEELRKIRELK